MIYLISWEILAYLLHLGEQLYSHLKEKWIPIFYLKQNQFIQM